MENKIFQEIAFYIKELFKQKLNKSMIFLKFKINRSTLNLVNITTL